MLKFAGKLQYNNQPVGLFEGFYVFSDCPDSSEAFVQLWDSESESCAVFESLLDPEGEGFREPLAELLESETGILYIDYIALRPKFRGIGVGREAMREIVRLMADSRVGAVLLNSQPIQHRSYGYDYFDEEVRDLPWNSAEEDHRKLLGHFGAWGMLHLPGTDFVLAAPEVLSDTTAPHWPPAPLSEE